MEPAKQKVTKANATKATASLSASPPGLLAENEESKDGDYGPGAMQEMLSAQQAQLSKQQAKSDQKHA
jgi:hypothetical protein